MSDHSNESNPANRDAMIALASVPWTCDRCKRELRPWPLERGNVCSPKGWVYCTREATT